MSGEPFKRPATLSTEFSPKTFPFKTVGPTTIEVDVYSKTWLPSATEAAPIFVFLHGGGWIGGSRKEFNALLFEELLKRDFLIASFDYRLVPESSFVEAQLADIRDIEPWIRNALPPLLQWNDSTTSRPIIIGGASAGALLAMLTPSLWTTPPTAILSIYGPTNMHHLPHMAKGPFANLKLEQPDWDCIQNFANFAHPPSCTPPPTSMQDWLNDRTKFGMYMSRSEAVVDVLLHGLQPDEAYPEKRVFPRRSQLPSAAVDSISPLQLCSKTRYPPVCQVMGLEDSLFDLSHVKDFAAALEAQGIEHTEIIVEGADHAFDMFIKAGDPMFLRVTKPAVEWIQKMSSPISKS